MEQKTPRSRLRLNLFDAIVLVLALAAAAAMIWVMMTPTPTNKDDIDNGTIRYTARLSHWPEGTSSLVQIGDQLTDNVKNYPLGQIVDIRIEPCRIPAVDYQARKQVKAEVEGYEDVVVTVEVSCEIGKYDIMLSEYPMRVGDTVLARGDGYMGSGTVESIEILGTLEQGQEVSG